MTDSEQSRLQEAYENTKPWYRWGPYLSELQWGTVREDYSADGDAWDYFPHDHARSRAYRWGEDGLLGICEAKQPVVVADPEQSILAPSVGSGTSVVVRKVVPGRSVGRVVLAHRPPLSLRQIRSPERPGRSPLACFGDPAPLGVEAGRTKIPFSLARR